MDWRRAARRLLISAFLCFHLGATAVWLMPQCPIRQCLAKPCSYYMLPLGLWQYWGMFAPEPMRESIQLEAEVIDAQGMRHRFSFPHLADFSKWRQVPRFRHSKYAVNLCLDEFIKPREFAARHVLRKLDLPADAYPLAVHLYYDVQDPPPFGSLADPMKPHRVLTLANYDFSSPSEVRP